MSYSSPIPDIIYRNLSCTGVFKNTPTTTTTPEDVGAGVIQLGNATDQDYGDPVDSSLIYSDIDGLLKTKIETDGGVYQLSGPFPYIYCAPTGVVEVEVQANYKLLTPGELQAVNTAQEGFELNYSTGDPKVNNFQYTGTATKRFKITMDAIVSVENAATSYTIGTALNAVFDNDGVVVGAPNVDGEITTEFETAAVDYHISKTFITIALAPNATFSPVVKGNGGITDQIDFKSISYTVTSISVGED